jgi:formylmethanofuran dehydrogenase subunit E
MTVTCIDQDLVAQFLQAAGSSHSHICPRQVLGVRMGLYAGELLGLDLPRRDKRLLVIVETDGCFLDGVSASTACTPGRRTLRVEDCGKAVASFIDTRTGRAVRLVPAAGCRVRALDFAPQARSRWEGQLIGYQRMPAPELFTVQEVELVIPVEQILSLPSRKAICSICGEEIINGRELYSSDQVFCRACSGDAYYISANPHQPAK